jgi:hypothetical protein
MFVAPAARVKGSAIIAAILLIICCWLPFMNTAEPWGKAQNTAPRDWRSSAKKPPVELVVASVKRENTSWVHHFFPDWTRSVYEVDNYSASLTLPANKGREAMVYLTYIVANYDTLADVTVFIHGSRFSWHNDDPDYDNLPTLRRLNLSHVRAVGYANLRCVWTIGCPVEIRPFERIAGEKERAKGALHDGKPLRTAHIFEHAFRELMPDIKVPHEVGVSCCAQFAVSRDAIRSRPKADYVRWREWLLKTPLSDDFSGRVLEYMWHSEYFPNLPPPVPDFAELAELVTDSNHQSSSAKRLSSVLLHHSAIAICMGCAI